MRTDRMLDQTIVRDLAPGLFALALKGKRPQVAIYDTLVIEDVRDWTNGKPNCGPRYWEVASQIPRGCDIAWWQAVQETSWSRLHLSRLGNPLDREINVELAAAEAEYLTAVMRRLACAAPDSARAWLSGSKPPGWVRNLCREQQGAAEWAKEVVTHGMMAWQLQCAAGLLVAADIECNWNKGFREDKRLDLYRTYRARVVEATGGSAAFEETLVLLRLFHPKANELLGVLKELRQQSTWRDPAKTVKLALNVARDLAMVRHLHDAEAGVGGNAEPRRAWLVTRDRPLTKLFPYLPRPYMVGTNGVLGYAMDPVIEQLPVSETTRAEILAVIRDGQVTQFARVSMASSGGGDLDDQIHTIARLAEGLRAAAA